MPQGSLWRVPVSGRQLPVMQQTREYVIAAIFINSASGINHPLDWRDFVWKARPFRVGSPADAIPSCQSWRRHSTAKSVDESQNDRELYRGGRGLAPSGKATVVQVLEAVPPDVVPVDEISSPMAECIW